jgi:hypothetical protein
MEPPLRTLVSLLLLVSTLRGESREIASSPAETPGKPLELDQGSWLARPDEFMLVKLGGQMRVQGAVKASSAAS